MADINKNANININVKGDQKAKSSLSKIGDIIKKRLVVTVGELGRALKGLIVNFNDLIKTGVKFIQLERSFKRLSNSYGVNSKLLLKELKGVADGTISTIDLMEKSNNALLLTNGAVAEQLPQILKIVKASSKATGQDMAYLFNSMAIGLGRVSPKIIDNLGLTVKIGEANEEYAKQLGKTSSQLSETEQKQAFINAVIKAGNDLIKKTSDGTEDALDAYKRLDASSKDLADTLKKRLVVQLAGVANWFGKIAQSANALLGRSPLEQLVIDANKISESLGLGTRSLEEYTTATENLSVVDAELYAQQKKNMSAREMWQKRNVGKQIEELAFIQRQIEAEKLKQEQELAAEKILLEKNKAARKKEEADAKEKKDLEEMRDIQIAFAQEASDAVGKITEDGGQAALEMLKKSLSAQIDAWMATEIGKLTLSSFTTFGASLAAIAPTIAAGTAAKAALNAVKFAQGGQFETQANPQSYSTTSGQGAVTNEKGIEIHKVEAIGKSTGGGGSVAPIVIMLGQKELKRIAVDLKPYLNAVDRGII